jgi:hypothetical protein
MEHPVASLGDRSDQGAVVARSGIVIEVKEVDGDVVPTGSVNIKKRIDATNATLYDAETGGSTISNPVTVDSLGRMICWVDRGDYNAIISGTGITTYTMPLDAAPAGDREIDLLWLPAAQTPAVLTNTGAGTTPALPTDGDRFIWAPALAEVSPTEFRYRAASPSTYKWECIGGRGFIVEMINSTKSGVASGVQTSNHVGWSTPDKATFTVPFTGEYDCHLDAAYTNSGTGTYFVTGVSVNGATVNQNPTAIQVPTPGYYGGTSHQVRVSCTAGDVLTTAMSYVVGGGPFTISRQHASLLIIPARVL